MSSYNPLNTAVYLDKSRSFAVGVQLESVHDTSAIVSLNSSAELDKSLVTPNKAVRAFRRKRSNTENSLRLYPPSLPLTVKKLPQQLERYLLSLTQDETLAFVKRDIENSSLASDDDPELHAPLFRNISTFKRSYEWMERLLKIYIYQDGEPPILSSASTFWNLLIRRMVHEVHGIKQTICHESIQRKSSSMHQACSLSNLREIPAFDHAQQ